MITYIKETLPKSSLDYYLFSIYFQTIHISPCTLIRPSDKIPLL